MWRWPTVAGQKEASAKAKAKIYSLHSKLIAIAAEKWADPTQNNALADAIHAAKKDGVTADVIDRAIKRGAGLDKESAKVEEIFYEGYAPGGVAIIVRALSDNRNRTAPNIRHIFSAFGGNMGETGSVSNFLFDYKGQITLAKPSDLEAFEMNILDTEAEDYSIGDGNIEVLTDRTHFLGVKQELTNAGYEVLSSGIGYQAKNFIEVTDFDNALKIYKMLAEFHDDEDVEVVWNNADISDMLWKEVEEYVAARVFRT